MGTVKETETGFGEKEVKVFLQSVVEKEGITNGEFHVSKGSEKGDGYMSYVIRVDIKGSKDLHLVIKCTPENPEFRNLMPVHVSFAREIRFYEEVYPVLQNFQKEKNVKQPFQCVAKCYKSQAEEYKELVVLRNIKEDGFRLWNRKLVMDDAHVSLVFNEYGKFHAISAALKQQNRAKFDAVSKDLTNLLNLDTYPRDMFDLFVNIQDKTKQLFCSEKEKGIYDRLHEFKDEIIDFFISTKENLGEYRVILHGDCWCNNMMFKYGDSEKPDKPTELCLIDFQLVRVGSPVFDLSYFFYAAASKEILDNLEHYLCLYYSSFKQHMIDLGSDPKEYSFEALKTDWKLYSRFGYIMAQCVIKAMLKDEDEIVDSTDNNADFISSFNEDIRSEYIDDRFRNLSLHMYENGFL